MLSLCISSTLRRTAVVAGVIVSTVACSDEATAPRRAPRVPPGISAVDNPDLLRLVVLPPVINGKIGPTEYTGAATASFNATLPSGGTTPVTVYVKHQGTYLYLATEFDRMSPIHSLDQVVFDFDRDNDGKAENGDDIVFTRANTPPNVLSGTWDYYRFQSGSSSSRADVADGGTNDAVAAWGANGTKAVFEIRHPLNSADNVHDISIDPSNGAVSVGLKMSVYLEKDPVGSNQIVPTLYPAGKFCKLTIGQSSTSLTCP